MCRILIVTINKYDTICYAYLYNYIHDCMLGTGASCLLLGTSGFNWCLLVRDSPQGSNSLLNVVNH